jgi:hypothetical protein
METPVTIAKRRPFIRSSRFRHDFSTLYTSG